MEKGKLKIYFKKLVSCHPFGKLRMTLSLSKGHLSLVTCLRGQSLIELLIAIGLSAILIPALFAGIATSREGRAQESQRLEAAILYREAQEAVRSVREKGWTNIATNGTYHPAISGSEWSLVSGSEAISGYTRQVVIAEAQRDAGGQIVESGGTVDQSTKKITTTVSWTTPFASKIETANYYQRYLGNSAFTHTTQADFNGGATNNTQTTNGGTGTPGAVELTQSAGAGGEYGNKFLLTATSAIGNMTSSAMKTSLRFTAQAAKTPTAIRVYLQTEAGTSPTYRYGIQANSGTNPSGAWLCSNTLVATSTGWKTISLIGCPTINAGTIYHIVVEYASGTISTSRYVALRRSAPLNSLYPYNNASDANANTLFNSGSGWTVQGFQPIYELDFSDSTYEGNPYETSFTYGSTSSVTIYGSNNRIGEKFTVSGGDKTTAQISFYVSQNSATEPLDSLQVELRDSTNNTIESGILATAAQTTTTFTYFTYTFSIPRTLTNGSTYRIFLKSPGSNSTNFYRVYRLVNTSGANYNSINYDSTNSVYTQSTNGGSSWAETANWDIGGFYFTIAGTTSFATNGTFESHASGSFAAGAAVAFNNVTWTANVPGGTTTLNLQVAISNCSNGATNPPACSSGTWDYFGSDGNSGSYFASPGSIPLSRINGRYVRYKAIFTSNGSATPTLNDVSINYSP